jgi:hypothetical protein
MSITPHIQIATIVTRMSITLMAQVGTLTILRPIIRMERYLLALRSITVQILERLTNSLKPMMGTLITTQMKGLTIIGKMSTFKMNTFGLP